MKRIRIGAGAGFSGDRIEPAVELAHKGELDFLVFECLAERTIALAQTARRHDQDAGFDPLLDERIRAVLGICRARGTKIISNMGAANPLGAARRIAAIASELGLKGLRIAAVTGDDVLAAIRERGGRIEESGDAIAGLGDRIISANAYLGAEPIARALADGADVVITGRASDTALFLAPLVHAFGWALDDWERLGQGTVVGHLLECAGQVTGGYFADPGFKDVRGLARLGFPLGEVSQDGSVVVTKVPGSGGLVTSATCKEQLIYEIHDPAAYVQPDVVADFTGVTVEEVGPDRILVTGGSGRSRPDTLKVSVAYSDSHMGEGQISYAGPGALARAQLALDIVRERLDVTGLRPTEIRFDLIGIDSLHAGATARAEPSEVRIRVAARTDSLEQATRIGNEVEALYTNGPAGGGGAFKTARPVIGVVSTLLPRDLVSPDVVFLEARP